MSKFNYTLTSQEVNKLLGESGKRAYVYKGHSFRPLRQVGKNYCPGCGLVRLNNKITDWCVLKGCNYSDNPHYKAAVKRLTRKT